MKSADVSWALYIRNGLGRRLSQLGERLGYDRLIYNPLVMRQFHDDGKRNAPLIVPALVALFPDCRILLDVGAGTGTFAAEFEKQGRRAIALERSRHGRKLARRQGVDCRAFDLRRTPPALVPENPDLVYCFEVAEHLPPGLGEALVSYMARFQVPIVFSAAHPGQGGTGHINEQPRDYWIDRFCQHGYAEIVEKSNALRARFVAIGASSWFHSNPFVMFPS